MANVSGTNVTGKDDKRPTDNNVAADGTTLRSQQPYVAAHSNNPSELEVQASADEEGLKDLQKDAKSGKKTKEKLFPVKLLKNYRPIGEFEIAQPNPETGAKSREPTAEESDKVPAGTDILIPKDEAKRAIEEKIAIRNDPI